MNLYDPIEFNQRMRNQENLYIFSKNLTFYNMDDFFFKKYYFSSKTMEIYEFLTNNGDMFRTTIKNAYNNFIFEKDLKDILKNFHNHKYKGKHKRYKRHKKYINGIFFKLFKTSKLPNFKRKKEKQ